MADQRRRGYQKRFYDRNSEALNEKARQRRIANPGYSVGATPPDKKRRYNQTFRATLKHASLVYAIHLVGSRWKIGYTTDTSRLLSAYHRVAPEAELIWSHPGDGTLEREIQSELSALNVPHLSGVPSEVFELGQDRDLVVKQLDAMVSAILGEEDGTTRTVRRRTTGR
jgi:hypothetical protein